MRLLYSLCLSTALLSFFHKRVACRLLARPHVRNWDADGEYSPLHSELSHSSGGSSAEQADMPRGQERLARLGREIQKEGPTKVGHQKFKFLEGAWGLSS